MGEDFIEIEDVNVQVQFGTLHMDARRINYATDEGTYELHVSVYSGAPEIYYMKFVKAGGKRATRAPITDEMREWLKTRVALGKYVAWRRMAFEKLIADTERDLALMREQLQSLTPKDE